MDSMCLPDLLEYVKSNRVPVIHIMFERLVKEIEEIKGK